VPTLRRCWDLSEAHLKDAIGSRQAMAELVRQMAAVAQPDSGAPKILIALARLAKPSTDWIDGAIRIEIEPVKAGEKTRFTVMEDLGGGMRELVFPRFVVEAPFSEFERSLRLAARAILPLVFTPESKDRLVLTNKKTRTSAEPPSFELAEDCLRRSLPPAVRKSVAPAPAPDPAPKVAAPRPPAVPRVPLAPNKRPSKPAPAARPEDKPVLEMPRAAKVLDFGDFEATGEAKRKRPTRRPPRA
jgi:hypothetical protein